MEIREKIETALSKLARSLVLKLLIKITLLKLQKNLKFELILLYLNED